MAPTSPQIEQAGTASAPANSPPILHLDGSTVELGWFRRGEMHFESRTVEDPNIENLVAAAASLIGAAKIRRQGLVVCLAGSFFDSRQVLLGQLPDNEAAVVLERKAANGLGVSRRECLFWARRCVAPVAESAASPSTSQSTWLVHSRRRSEHMELLLRMRKAGIRVRRVVAGRNVLTHMLTDADPELGSILLANTGQAVFVQLFRGSKLVQESRLPIANFDERKEVYTTVMQDVRQLTAFWSKGSRGAALQSVRLFGFTELEVESMRPTLGIASQGAEVRVVGTPDSDGYEDVRKGLLNLFMTYGQSAHDLRIPLPTRASRLAVVAVALSVAAGAGAWKLIEYSDERSDQQTAQIAAELAGTESVEEDEAQRASYLSARDSLMSSIQSLDRVSKRGLPLDDLIQDVYGTLGRIVDVHHLAFKEGEEGPEFLFEGSLPDEAASAADQLEKLRRAAQRDRNFRGVAVQPSTRVPSLDQGETLTFTFTGTYAREDA